MTVVDNRTKHAVVFTKIKIGECFEGAGGLYIRVYPAHDENSGDHFNAISLTDGGEWDFEGGELVHPVQAHIVISNLDPSSEKGSYRDNY